MKSKLFVLLMMAFASSTFAQSGSWYIGGSGGFGSSKSKTGNVETKFTSWEFSPEIGTWATDNVQVGVGLNLSGTKFDGNDESNINTGGTLYGRYWWKPGQAFRPFVGLNIPVAPGKYTDFNGVDIKTFRTGANLNGGFGFALSPRVSVLGSLGVLGFSTETEKPDVTGAVKTTTTDFNLNVNSLGSRFDIGLYLTL